MKNRSAAASGLLNSTLLTSLGALALAAAPAAMAQSADSKLQVEEVRVTGSYIRQSDTYTAPIPTTTMNRDDIDASGAVDISDLVRNLAINSGSESQSLVTNQLRSAGTAQFNLRGLGLGATLTLINGRRSVLSARAADDGSQFVDINLLPLSMIDRLEIVKDGASALYGSDAVAGVVNIITRNTFEGFEMTGGYQTTTRSSQEDITVSGAYGWAGEDTNFTLFASYMDRSDLANADRPEFLAGTFQRPLSKVGTWIVPALGGPTRDPACGAAPITTPSGPILCLSDISLDSTIVPEEERVAVFSRLEHRFDDRLTANIEVNYGRTRTTWKAMHSFVSVKNGLVVPADHPNNPFGATAISFLWAPVSQQEYTAMGVDYEDLRNPNEYGSDLYRVAAGMTYEMGGDWTIDANAVYAESSGFYAVQNELFDQIQLYLNGGPDGQTYFNPFGSAILDPAQANTMDILDAISAIARMDSKTKLYTVDAVAAGTLADMPAGPLGLALGVAYRKDTIDTTFDDHQLNNDFAFFGQAENFSGKIDSYAAFAELAVPLAEGLNAQIAARYEDYGSGAGSTFDPKAAIAWDATDKLMVRGTIGTSFRAPSPLQTTSTLVTPSVAQPICQPDGTLAPARNAVAVRTAGTGNLKPEDSTSYTLGVAYQDDDNGFKASVDYWRYEYDNVVTRRETNSILAAACAAGGYQTDDRITAAGNVASAVDIFFENAGGITTDGFDFAASVDIEAGAAGMFTLSNHTNYVMTYTLESFDNTVIKGAGWRNYTNFGRSAPKWRSNLSLDWDLENHSATATLRYVSSYKDDANGRTAAAVGRIDDHVTLDLQYSYLLDSVGEGIRFTVGAINVTNEDPPSALSTGWDYTIHDPRGRMVYARIKSNF